METLMLAWLLIVVLMAAGAGWRAYRRPHRIQRRQRSRLAKEIRSLSSKICDLEYEIADMQTQAFFEKALREGMRWPQYNTPDGPYYGDHLLKSKPESVDEAREWIERAVKNRYILLSRTRKKLEVAKIAWNSFEGLAEVERQDYRSPAIQVRVETEFDDVEKILEEHEMPVEESDQAQIES